MITHEQRKEIYEILDARYMTRSECSARMDEVGRKLSSDDRRLAVIELQVKINNWLTLAVASGIIALVVKTFLGQ